ncbi:MAG: C4-dicarboxylate ABC transporter substrate-binding protein, partial [Desulfuromonadales bacterium]|nr:C4-dicarboxylate ABC transporter substrate-binding protein [Desulfuromonadales bacterium]
MHTLKLSLFILFFALSSLTGTSALAAKGKDPTANWKPKFDPSGAQYTYLLSCVGHPAIEGVGVGYRIRDKVWEKSDGRLFVDFRPLSQLGGEKDVIRKLQMGAVH